MINGSITMCLSGGRKPMLLYRDVPPEKVEKLRVGDFFECDKIIKIDQAYNAIKFKMGNGDVFSAHKKDTGLYYVFVKRQYIQDMRKAREWKKNGR
jgi:hypothetical protein